MSRLYHLEFSKIVLKFFTKHPEVEQRFFEKIPQLQKNPFDASLDIKALQGSEKGGYRLRIGKYRFKYVVIDSDIIVYFYDANSRGDIY